VYSTELLIMGREDARNMLSFITEYIWIISASGWLFKRTKELFVEWMKHFAKYDKLTQADLVILIVDSHFHTAV
jgi:hypothetical protein